MECKSGYNRDTYTYTFMVALFIIAKLSNQPRCPPIDEWIEKLWYLYTMEYCSAIKKSEIMSFTGKWMELEIITFRKISQVQEDTYHIFSLMCKI
jgi:hypothetical protein